MNKLWLLLIVFGVFRSQAQEMEIVIVEKAPYKAEQNINFEVYLSNTTDTILTYFDSRGPAWYSFEERWELSIDFQFNEIYGVNNKFDTKFADSVILSIEPGEKRLLRSKALQLGDAGEYRMNYNQEQGPQLVKKENADSDSTYFKSQHITPYKLSALIIFDVKANYDTSITFLHNMTWEEWRDYRHVQLFSRKKHFDNMHAAMLYPEDVYALKISCKGKTEDEIKQIGRLKNLRELSLRNYELDYYPKELVDLELFELTLVPMEGVVVDFPYGISKDSSIREMRAKFYGGFPACLLDLTKMEEFDLSDCILDSFPDLSSLAKLEVLIANNSELGNVNSAHLDSLSKLKELNLSGNKAISDFSPILSCSNLEFLILNRTSINEIPHEIKQLSKLKKLAISNKITFVSDSIGALSDLRYLSLGGNRSLEHVSDSIIKLTKLLHLDVSSTKINSLPEGISDLPLEKVMIYNTHCEQGKDYKALRRRLGENFKE